MLPKPFEKLFVSPMLDLEQALSFQFYYRPKLHTAGYRLVSQFKKGLQFRHVRMTKLTQISHTGESPAAWNQHV